MAVVLTKDAIKHMFTENELQPTVQILRLRKLEKNGRYRVQLSDGENHTLAALFSTQPSELIDKGEFGTNSVIKVDRYMRNSLPDSKMILMIISASAVASGEEVGQVIGNPVAYDPRTASSDDPAEISRDTPQKKIGGNSDKAGVHPIAALTPYQNKWKICARVTNKSDIRKWSNSRGDGKLFSVNLLDSTGEIRATAFTEDCDRLYNIFEENKLFYISGGSLKPANKKFSSLKNDYEITFNNGTTVSPCYDDDAGIPKMQFEFVSIDQLESLNNNDIVDVIGICTGCQDISTIQQKSTGRELKKRELQIVDSTNNEVKLTLWGSQAENFDGAMNPVIAIKGVRVSDFGGKSLSAISSSSIQINPDIKEAHKLRAWYDNEGVSSSKRSLSSNNSGKGVGSNFKMLAEANQQNMGASGDAEYYSAKATVNFIRQENCMYQACPGENCNKKVVDLTNGTFRCEKCSKEYDTFKWRLLLGASVCDSTDSVWVTLFQEQAESLLNCSADELAQLKEVDAEAYVRVFEDALFKEYTFRLRVKMDTYMDEKRLKTTVATISPVDPAEYARFLIADIQKMLS